MNKYALENGLTVGSSASEVVKQLGEPRKKKIELKPKGVEVDALVYDDFVFLLDKSKNVVAIRIGIEARHGRQAEEQDCRSQSRVLPHDSPQMIPVVRCS